MQPELKILKDILAEPTAPRHEHRVRAVLRNALANAGIPCRLDAYGNLIAHYKNGRARPVAMAAHMDHPGFEIISVSGTRAKARWEGQVPTFDLKGLKLTLWADAPAVGRRGSAIVLDGDGRRPRRRAAQLRLKVPPGTRIGDFGHAALPAFRLAGGRIFSKALDNTAGCAAIAAAIIELARRRGPGDVIGLFTRSEENGFKGAFAAIRAASIPKARPLVVLECSKELPGAVMGMGPVIRIGDRILVFDPDLAAACVSAAQSFQKRRKDFRFQRRLMDGGACEATAFALAGYRAVCLALPLGNYHNIGKSGIRTEYISERDYLDCVRCLRAFVSPGLDPAGTRRRLQTMLAKRFTPRDAALLKNTA